MSEDIKDTTAMQDEVTTEAPKPKAKRGRPKKTQPVDAPMADELEALKKQVNLLTQALLAERAIPKDAVVDDKSVGIQRVSGSRISTVVRDAYGSPQHFVWETVGQVNYLTKKQYEEMMESPAGKRMFDRGFLALEEEVNSGTVLVDMDEYINGLDMDSIEAEVNSVEDPAFLMRVMNYLENLRVVTSDENGRPLLTPDGQPYADVKTLTPKQRVLADSVVARLYELTNVRYSLIDNG